MKFFTTLLLISFLPILVACQTLIGKDLPQGPSSAEADPTATANATPEPMSPDLVYGLLVGEIATQRGEYDLAYDHYLEAARSSRDPWAAEQATRIAMHLKRDEAALRAAKIWIDLDPTAVSAYQVATILETRADNLDAAEEYLRKLLASYTSQGKGGWLEAGVVASQAKDDKIAIELMQRLTRDQQENPDALYAMAVVAMGAKEHALAEQKVREALAHKPAWARAQVLLSRVLVARKDMDGARAALLQAVKDDPENLAVRTAFARLLVDTTDYSGALEQFKYVESKQKDDADVLFAIGVLALQLERAAEAKEYFQRLWDLSKREDEAAFYLGQIAEVQGDKAAAAEWYGRVKSEYFLDAQIRRFQLTAAGDLDHAREQIQQLRQQVPSASVRLYLVEAELLRESGKPQVALSAFDAGLRAHPEDTDLLYARALHAATMDRLDILEADLNFIIKNDPMHADALNALGYTLADQTARYDEALSYIQRALAIKPDNAAILDSMGWVHYRMGNNEKALEYLRRAMELLPDSEIAAHLGEVLWVSGAKEKAKKVWDEALLKEPGSVHLRKVLQRYR